jgi:hypothetical protein
LRRLEYQWQRFVIAARRAHCDVLEANPGILDGVDPFVERLGRLRIRLAAMR